MIGRLRRPTVAASLALVPLSLAACAAGGGGAAVVPRPVSSAAGVSGHDAAFRAQLQAKIQHVIVVDLENRSFDDIFETYDHTKADIASISGTATYHGAAVTLQPATLSASNYDVDHSHQGWLADYDGGKNDGFPPQNATNPGGYGYVPQGEVQPYLDIAKQFAISDRFFHGITAPTFPSHLELGAASTFGVIDNPSDTVWGCDSAPGTTTGLYDPAAAGEEDKTAGPFPCFDELSIFDLLDRGVPKPVTWRYYDEPEGTAIVGELVIPAYFRHIRYGPDWNSDIDKSDTQINADLATGSLQQVSYVIPNETSTDHAGTPSLGPTYIENLVNAFGASQYYANSLMIITWDDWGGWYDHVVPPKRADGSQLSFRKPILFVGGYVKQGYVSHVQTEDASIDTFLEELFGLGTLGQHDLTANSFDDVFDFTDAGYPHAFARITSPQGATVPVGNPPLTLGARFRVIPSGFGAGSHGASFAPDGDYYAKRSADY